MNFLSTGNMWTEVQLDRSKSTLIIGENGAGKSTLIDALFFVLFGKAFRDINKPQLVNSITNKNLVVEVEFQIGKRQYFIKRGIKPNFFEIYANDKLIDQSSSVRDYQTYFEKHILKMNDKTFGQIVVLGSRLFVPFMKLPAHGRRNVIEDLLDIEIFSIMNVLLKEKITQNKMNIQTAIHTKELIESKIEMQRTHIQSLRQNTDDMIAAKEEAISEVNIKIENATNKIQELTKQVKELNPGVVSHSKFQAKHNEYISIKGKLNDKVDALNKEIEFFRQYDNCPTCKQSINDHFKKGRIINRENQKNKIENAQCDLMSKLQKIQDSLDEIDKINDKINSVNDKITECNTDLRSYSYRLKSLREEIESLQSNTSVIDKNKHTMKSLKAELDDADLNKEDLINHKEMLEVAASLLKDNGIKTRIIKQYVPIINKLISKYLAAMEFFVQFELNENFVETIKSRHRDEFTYGSFSEGEKMRIDLALLFTWRTVAKLRNSASTNILIMDEVFDASLDKGGVEEFLKILTNIVTDTNIFVISHASSDSLYDKFHSVIKFEKTKNFSRIAA